MSNATTSHPTAGVAALQVTPLQKSLRILTAALALWSLGMLAATVARAEHEDDRHVQRSQIWRGLETWAEGNLVDVQLRVDGEPAPLYWQPGRHDRRYLQAFAGRNYSVVLRNNSGNRVAVLLAVDGLNVVNGEMSQLRSSEPMYVLGPWEQATIRGWRSSLKEIRRFVFVDERRSYAERTGQANGDMGWIRVLSFREQLSWWEKNQRDWGKVKGMYDDGSGYRSSPAPQAAPQARSQESLEEAAPNLEGKRQTMDGQKSYARGEESYPGTGWGDRSEDRVRRVQFEPEKNATDRLIFRYEYAAGLRALGIVPVRNDRRDRLYERDGDLGFAKPPRW